MARVTTKPAAKAAPEAKSAQATAAKRIAPVPSPAPQVAPPRPTPGIRRAADFLKQASDPTRLQILLMLGDGERNVTELRAALPAQSQPAVSHHIALLRHGRLIERRRSANHNYYGLTEAGRGVFRIIGSVMA